MFNSSDQAMEEKKVDMSDMIQRELEKEMIREKIIAEEVGRFHVLEAEVRKELMIGREMMAMKSGMNSGKEFPSSFMLGSQPGRIKLETCTTSLTKVGTGNPYAPTLPEVVKLKPPPPSLPFVGGSTELKSCSSKKMEWRCSICKISAPCERGLLEHLAGKNHHAKAASIVIKNSPKCVPRLTEKMEWRCPICEISAPCERGLQDHLAGKKHQAKVEALRADNIENAMRSVELPKTKLDWRCPICEVSASCERGLQDHLAGKKHMKAKWAVIKGKNI